MLKYVRFSLKRIFLHKDRVIDFFSLKRIFLYKDRVIYSVLIRENLGQQKRVFLHILRSDGNTRGTYTGIYIFILCQVIYWPDKTAYS